MMTETTTSSSSSKIATAVGPCGKRHRAGITRAEVPDAGGTRLVVREYPAGTSRDEILSDVRHYRDCPALRGGNAPIVWWHGSRRGQRYY